MTTSTSSFRHAARCASLALTLLGAGAGAQSLSAPEYRAISAAVNAAVRERASSPTRSFADLDKARSLLDAANLGSSPLLEGVRTALSNARIAVGRSQTDLEAQAAQVNGFLRKALYDASLEATQGRAGEAVQSVSLLAEELGVAPAERPALLAAARAGQVDAVRAQLERAAITKMQSNLAVVKATNPADVNPANANSAARASSYLALARAGSFFNVVQDSPRAGDLSGRQFVQALDSLTRGDGTAYASQLRALRAGAARFAASAAQAARDAPSEVPQPERPSANPSGPTPSSPAPSTTSTQPPRTAASGAPVDLDALYVPLTGALTASGHGDNAAARDALGRAAQLFAALPPAVRNARGAEALRADVDRVQRLGALRTADVRALLGSLGNLRREQTGEAPSALDALGANVLRAFGGAPRTALFVLLGLLALYPLYLLNLAFGGRNPYWRAIGGALALLLLPVMLEGLAGLGALLESLSGAGALSVLTNLSLLQNPLGGPIWALLTALAIGLATWGFRGICVQFGLLGRRTADVNAGQPAVEWDEEL